MKYLIELQDDDGVTVYKNWTSLGELAEDYVVQARAAERKYDIEHQVEPNFDSTKCKVCKADLVAQAESQDIDGNRTMPVWVCPNNR